MSKIELTDNFETIMYKMSEGNPGALTCMIQTLKDSKTIDPNNMLEGMSVILAADELKIYGSHLYVLWNDLCDRDSKLFIALFKGYQLGFISGELLQIASQDETRQSKNLINIIDLHEQVCNKLPNFMK